MPHGSLGRFGRRISRKSYEKIVKAVKQIEKQVKRWNIKKSIGKQVICGSENSKCLHLLWFSCHSYFLLNFLLVLFVLLFFIGFSNKSAARNAPWIPGSFR